MDAERKLFAQAAELGARRYHDPDAVPEAQCVGVAYAGSHHIGDVLRMCAAALEDHNVHDLADLCRERVGDVPAFLTD